MVSFIFGLTPEPRHAYVAPFAFFINVVRKRLRVYKINMTFVLHDILPM